MDPPLIQKKAFADEEWNRVIPVIHEFAENIGMDIVKKTERYLEIGSHGMRIYRSGESKVRNKLVKIGKKEFMIRNMIEIMVPGMYGIASGHDNFDLIYLVSSILTYLRFQHVSLRDKIVYTPDRIEIAIIDEFNCIPAILKASQRYLLEK